MERPIVLAIQEFKEAIATTINKYSSEIPAVIMADSVEPFIINLRQVGEQQYAQAQINYEASKKEETKDEKAN